MKATELIGKNVVRTAPTKAIGDRSYTNTPIYIVNATDHNIAYKHADEFGKKMFGDKTYLLGCDWTDDNWTSYDELINPAVLGVREVERSAKIGEWIRITNDDAGREKYYLSGDIGKVIEDKDYGVFATTKKTHPCNCGEGTSFLYHYEYVVLENYQPEDKQRTPLSEYTNREIAEELLRRYS